MDVLDVLAGFHIGFSLGREDISIRIAIKELEHTSVDFDNILDILKHV